MSSHRSKKTALRPIAINFPVFLSDEPYGTPKRTPDISSEISVSFSSNGSIITLDGSLQNFLYIISVDHFVIWKFVALRLHLNQWDSVHRHVLEYVSFDMYRLISYLRFRIVFIDMSNSETLRPQLSIVSTTDLHGIPFLIFVYVSQFNFNLHQLEHLNSFVSEENKKMKILN